MKKSYVYILSGRGHRTLYIGVTVNLISRVQAHRLKKIDGFTKKYHLTKLVYFEVFDEMRAAISREKQLKKWRRPWKVKLIEEQNPDWEDLYDKLIQSMEMN